MSDTAQDRIPTDELEKIIAAGREAHQDITAEIGRLISEAMMLAHKLGRYEEHLAARSQREGLH